jgi:hypothetical protein
MGEIAGATMGHIVGGQIGGRSIVPSQIGCVSPFTHWHAQLAYDADVEANREKANTNFFIFNPTSLGFLH